MPHLQGLFPRAFAVLTLGASLGLGFHGYAVYDRGPKAVAVSSEAARSGKVTELHPGLFHAQLSGEGYALGLQHGSLLKEEVRAVVTYLLQTVLQGSTLARDASLVKAWSLHQHMPLRFQQELRGISDGAAVPYPDLLLINTYDDLAHLMGCSSAVVLPKDPKDPLLHGRNLDYPIAELAKHKVVFDIETRGRKMRTVGFPGYLGVLTGMSSKGLSLSSHTSAVKNNRSGIPSGVLYRLALEEAEDLPSLVQTLRQAPRTIGNNLALGDGFRKTALAVELSAQQLAQREPVVGRIFVTNHFQIPTLQNEQNPVAYAKGSGSVSRVSCLAERLPGEKSLDSRDLEMALSDEKSGGAGRGWRSPANKGTVQSVVMEPKSGALWVAIGQEIPVTRGGYRALQGWW